MTCVTDPLQTMYGHPDQIREKCFVMRAMGRVSIHKPPLFDHFGKKIIFQKANFKSFILGQKLGPQAKIIFVLTQTQSL